MRHVRIRLIGLSVIVAAAASGLAGSSASATIPNPVENPTASLEIFENCPVHAISQGGIQDELCIFGATEVGPPGSSAGGKFTVGGITTPIEKQIVLQYGLSEDPTNGVLEFNPPTHGAEAIAPTPELVPGEPIGHITAAEQEELGWPRKLMASYATAQAAGLTKEVFETIEIAGIPATNTTNIIFEEGTGVEAPVKIKGENAWLSELKIKCVIGSNEDPIVQHLTSGKSVSPLTGEELHGLAGSSLEITHGGAEVWLSGSLLVDNTYAVPTATCSGKGKAKKFVPAIERTIDKEFNLPQPAGASVTVIHGTLYDAAARFIETELGL